MTDSTLPSRIRESIAEEPVAAFARRCDIGESLIRKYLAGSEPSATNLVKIADAAGVSLDWLATGRGPKRREYTEKTPQNQTLAPLASGPHARRWQKIIELVEAMPEHESSAIVEEFFARARDKAEAVELRQAVAELRAAIKRA
ncbi:MAG: helix-turn-helix domain-containing protein [Burkholderiaceae bacterium]